MRIGFLLVLRCLRKLEVFRILLCGIALPTIMSGELRAQTDLSKAIAEFERTTTRTLSVRGISIP